MTLLTDLQSRVNSNFHEQFTTEATTIVPATDYSKLTFGNKGLTAELTFLFVDIRKSSQLLETYGYVNAARLYQSFHDINVRIIERHKGQVRSFDGDRVMGIFSGDQKSNNAVEAALEIRWAIAHILNLHLKQGLNIGLGVDTGPTLITKVGKGRDISNNDLVWVGKACNYASHMCNESENEIYISPAVYDVLFDPNKLSSGKLIWSKVSMKLKNSTIVSCYSTNYYKPLL